MEEVAERYDLRTPEQNKKMWALLTDLANQVDWPVNGALTKLDPGDWKHVMTAGLRREQRIADGISGGFVVLGQYTHKFSKQEMSELIELIYAFGAERGVKWSDAGADLPDIPSKGWW